MTPRCQCPDEGRLGCPASWYDALNELPYVNHQPNRCNCTNDLRLYRRRGAELWLCSICVMFGDDEVIRV